MDEETEVSGPVGGTQEVTQNIRKSREGYRCIKHVGDQEELELVVAEREAMVQIR